MTAIKIKSIRTSDLKTVSREEVENIETESKKTDFWTSLKSMFALAGQFVAVGGEFV